MSTVYAGSDAWPAAERGVAVAIGNFDGVHLGHRAVLRALAERAGARGLRTAVYTFDPAPTAVVAPARHQPRILPLDDRVRLLAEAGADGVCVEPFDAAYAARPAEWFAAEVLGRRLGARMVSVGYDFRFGAGRAGDVDTLRRLLPGVEVVHVEAVVVDGAPVSSSRIRKLVAAGEVEAAAALLGRPHRLRGEVVHGDHRGRTIGFPTANVANRVELLPAPGVYAVRVGVGGAEAALPGVANVGLRPTFSGTEPRVEVHLLAGGRDLYGAELTVELVRRLREERRFPSVEALVEQIGADAEAARRCLG